MNKRGSTNVFSVFKSGLSLATTVACFMLLLAIGENGDYWGSMTGVYRNFVGAVMAAGLFGTLIGILLLLFDVLGSRDELGRFVSLLLALAFLVIGWSLRETYSLACETGDIATLPSASEILTTFFALLTTLATGLALWKTRCHLWAMRLLGIEIPLLLGLGFIVSAKVWIANESSIAENNWISNLSFYPKGRPAGWVDTVSEIKSVLRASFWTGVLTAVVGLQLLVAQISNFCLSLYVAYFDPAGEASRAATQNKPKQG